MKTFRQISYRQELAILSRSCHIFVKQMFKKDNKLYIKFGTQCKIYSRVKMYGNKKADLQILFF